MTIRKWALGALCALAGASIAQPASAEPIERSGNTFHVAVCARGQAPGVARCHAHVVVDARGNEIAGKSPTAGPNVTPSGYGPSDLRSAYAVGAGSGSPTIAIVDAYGYTNAESDLGVYRAQYGLPPCTTANGCFKKIDQNGGTSYPRVDTGWAQESALDLDMASAMCPNCKLVLVEASSATLSNLATAVRTAAGLSGVIAISNSYGGGETGSSSYAASYNQPGKAVTVSTGDSGYGAQFPATAPNVIAVGGTHLVRASNSRGWDETAWSSGGSGCSSVYGKPAWQTDGSCAARMEADISAVGDPNTGVAVYGPTNRTTSGWLVFGGTSVSAPLVAGIYGVKGSGATNGGSSIWANPGSFHDVTSGSNGSCGGTYFCTAGPGYDGPTGMGTPNGTAGL